MLIKSGGKNKGQWTYILATKHSLYPTECLGLCSTTLGLKALPLGKVKTLGSVFILRGLNSVLGVYWKGVMMGDEKGELEHPENKLRLVSMPGVYCMQYDFCSQRT